MEAILTKNRASVELLLSDKKRVDVSIYDTTKYRSNALLRACTFPHDLAIVEMLLKDGRSDINSTDSSGVGALCYAAMQGSKDLAELLLNQEDVDVNLGPVSALAGACQKGHGEIVDMLLGDKRVNVNFRNPRTGATALFLAIAGNHSSIVERLLRVEGIDSNTPSFFQNVSCLVLAIEVGNTDVIKMMLGVPNIDINMVVEAGYTPLVLSIIMGREEAVQMLLARPDCAPGLQLTAAKGEPSEALFTAMHFAARDDRVNVVRWLLADPRVDPGARASGGATPLHVSCSTTPARTTEEKVQIVKMLMEDSRVDTNAVMENGCHSFVAAAARSNRCWHFCRSF